jgi:hypothetical protein
VNIRDMQTMLGMRAHTPAQPGQPSAVTIGAATKLNSQPLAGGVFGITQTQLITANSPTPQQWVVTLLQAKSENGTTPWQFTEGQNGTGGPNNVPRMPVYADTLMCDVRFGAGGVSSRAAFDYPSGGATLGLTCDAFDLSVQMRSTMLGIASAWTYATLAEIPMVGAFMVPGAPTDSELTWTESPKTLAGVGENAFYTVKPYAKRLRGWVSGSAGTPLLQLVNAGGSTVWQQPLPGAAAVIDIPVPCGAQFARFINGTTAMDMYLQWVIELS